METYEYRRGAWNVTTKMIEKAPYKEWVEQTHIVIASNSIKEANKFMESNYTDISDNKKHWFEKCHHRKKENGIPLFCYIIKRKQI